MGLGTGSSSRRTRTDPNARRAVFDELLAGYCERGKALRVATVFEIDHVIDPADPRDVLTRVLVHREPG